MVDNEINARSAARRAALCEAATICDKKALDIAAANPGRKRGSVSAPAEFAIDAIKEIAASIRTLRDSTDVPW